MNPMFLAHSSNNFKKKRKRISRSSTSFASSNKLLLTFLRIVQWAFYALKLIVCTIHRILMTRFVPSLNIKILFLVCPLALFLYLWTGKEDKGGDVTTLAVIIALKRHVPSRRVFDCMLEFSLVGFCASFAVYIWECTFYQRLNKEEQQLVWDQLWIPPFNDSEYDVDNEGDEDEDEQDSDDGGELPPQQQVEMSHLRRGSLELSTSHRQPSSQTHVKHYGPTTAVDIISSPSKPYEESKNFTQSSLQLGPHATSHQILHASVDLLLLILVALFLFTMSETVGGYYIDELSSTSSNNHTSLVTEIISRVGAVAAPIFPLLLFLYASIHFLLIPWSKTKARFWTLVSYTVTTPLYPVTFRDGLVGDIITSLVRPLQDAVFTLVYLVCGLRGWWIYNKIPDAVQTELLTTSAMESSWMIHTWLLPACIISPLWWRYIQTLRQVYQYRSRWPYLGNSGKYFCAAQIAILGIMYPEWRSSPWGIFFFVLVTLYQVSWDIFMDWELLEWKKDGIALREQRIFQSPFTYYSILIVNVLLRFCWTMTFIPSRYLSPTSGLLMYTFSADFSTFKGPALASAEIIRRTLWTLLRVELEIIKVIQRPSAPIHGEDLERNTSEESLEGMIYKADTMTAMPIMQSVPSYRRNGGPFQSIRTNIQDLLPIFLTTTSMSSASEIQIVRELLLYATLFIGFGIVAIIHRGVM